MRNAFEIEVDICSGCPLYCFSELTLVRCAKLIVKASEE